MVTAGIQPPRGEQGRLPDGQKGEAPQPPAQHTPDCAALPHGWQGSRLAERFPGHQPLTPLHAQSGLAAPRPWAGLSRSSRSLTQQRLMAAQNEKGKRRPRTPAAEQRSLPTTTRVRHTRNHPFTRLCLRPGLLSVHVGPGSTWKVQAQAAPPAPQVSAEHLSCSGSSRTCCAPERLQPKAGGEQTRTEAEPSGQHSGYTRGNPSQRSRCRDERAAGGRGCKGHPRQESISANWTREPGTHRPPHTARLSSAPPSFRSCASPALLL